MGMLGRCAISRGGGAWVTLVTVLGPAALVGCSDGPRPSVAATSGSTTSSAGSSDEGDSASQAASDSTSDTGGDPTDGDDDSTTGSQEEGSCGNGILEGTEQCDGEDFDGQTCSLLGAKGGSLACTSTCKIDVAGCVFESCGNGLLDEGELCDGFLLAAETCESQGFVDGTLACLPDCTGFDTSKCSSCGDGVIDETEACDDGEVEPGDGCSASCQIESFHRCTGAAPSTCAPIRILFAPAEADDESYRASIAAFTGGVVDYVDARDVTPQLEDLQDDYDCVVTFPDQPYDDATAMGDVLAEFVDAGGVVSLGVFSTYSGGNALGGAIMEVGYSPVSSPTGDNHFELSAYAGDGASILHDGVTAYAGRLRDVLVLQGEGLQDGSFQDGEIATAYRPDFRVVYLNGSGHDDFEGTGDWPRLVANSCAAAFATPTSR